MEIQPEEGPKMEKKLEEKNEMEDYVEKQQKKEEQEKRKRLYDLMKHEPVKKESVWTDKISNMMDNFFYLMNRYVQLILIMIAVIFLTQIVVSMMFEMNERGMEWRVKNTMHIIELSKMMGNITLLRCPWLEKMNLSACPFFKNRTFF